MSWKDKLSLFISSLALILSAVSTYFTLFRQVDEVSASIQSSPWTLLRLNDVTQLPGVPFTVVFINSGTRSVAVLKQSLELSQRKVLERPNCENAGEPGISHEPLHIESFVLKESEIVTKNMVPKNSARPPPIRWDEGLPPIMDLCLVIELATPSLARYITSIAIESTAFGKDGRRISMRTNYSPPSNAPKVLLRHKRGIFDFS
jgi:hypothetical protein